MRNYFAEKQNGGVRARGTCVSWFYGAIWTEHAIAMQYDMNIG